MSILFYGAIKSIFSMHDRYKDKYISDYEKKNYRRIVEFGIYEVIPEEGYFDDAMTDSAIIDKCVEDDSSSVDSYFEDLLNCIDEFKKNYPDTEILEVCFGEARAIATVYKDKIEDTAEFLDYFKVDYRFNPDYEKEMSDLEEEAEEAIKEAEIERREMESMRRSSYYW